MSNKEKLLEMKQQLDDLTKQESELKGQRKEIIKNLKTDFDVKNIGEAEKLLKKLEKQGEVLGKNLNKIIDKLEEEYEWG